MKTRVCIIGGGPAGVLLAQLLWKNGVDSMVLERQSRAHVLGRIRAGVLEWGSVEVLRAAGVGGRLEREGIRHDGVGIAWDGGYFFIDTEKYAGRPMMTYGQTKITEDLYAARDAAGGVIIDNAKDVMPHDVDTDAPHVTYYKDGRAHRIDCDFVAGCDGFHGVSRAVVPAAAAQVYEQTYPFGWLGIMSETPPYREVVYASSARGFALASMRGPRLSRHYIQCGLDTDLNDWDDAGFWKELKRRFPKEIADAIVTGPSIEKSIAPLRSFVAEPMRWRRLFLAGDAAHIVPPTGAKGLNLAVSDVFYLARAFSCWYRERSTHYLDNYSDMALRRVWRAVRFSWHLTHLLHRFPGESEFSRRLRDHELAHIASSESGTRFFCEQYAGLPLES